jgi:gliding motility-associated-like protein
MNKRRISILGLFALLLMSLSLFAEGSKDLVTNKGYRLFFNAQQRQQLKVYAEEGEFIQAGSSHVGIAGGFMRVIRPDGTEHTIYNNTGPTAGMAIIFNRTQEFAGPTGGGMLNGPGYIPGVIPVEEGEGGVWTITLEYPSYSTSAFANKLNTDNWIRILDQPNNQRVVLAWDITVSKLLPANDGGQMLSGRVFTQEYSSVVNENGNLTDARFFVISDEGIQYKLEMDDIDPWGWFITSNNRGLVNSQRLPVLQSKSNDQYIRSWMPQNWQAGEIYHYEPQTKDNGHLKNNKLFFNLPDPDLPEEALVYDVFRQISYLTWLNPPIPDYSNPLYNVNFSALPGPDPIYSICGGLVMGVGQGGFVTFETVGWGTVQLRIDINQNGQYSDPVDVMLTKTVTGGLDSIFWNGLDNMGVPVPAQDQFPLNLSFSGIIYSGEMHLMIFDVENTNGGISITRLNGPDPGIVDYYYDHSEFGGGVSGGGTPGNALPTNQKYAYTGFEGDEKMMDYWSYISADAVAANVTVYIKIVDDCTDGDLDSDDDDIIDIFDLDDDNDGIPDKLEYCMPTGGFTCLPGGLDPSGDEDQDKILNFRDAQDPAFTNPCDDLNGDGVCDNLPAIYDLDADGVPDHLDLDSDNDGISDLDEAAHGAPDVLPRDGRIDGPKSDFGDNGFYNALSNKPNGQDAIANYTLPDRDNDGVPDNDDRDSDNDGIHDLTENNMPNLDSNNDGAIDDGSGSPDVDPQGIPKQVSPFFGNTLPLPVDFDGDGVRNQNDRDSDNDGLMDAIETINPDGDGDGIIGIGVPTVDGFGRPIKDALNNPLICTSITDNTDNTDGPDFQDLDSDGDGIWDTYEAEVYDPDMDGIAGKGVPQVDEHGVPFLDENGDPIVHVNMPNDNDNDGFPDYKDVDSDNDSISDGYECFDIENGYTMLPCLDTDSDGVPDIFDLDSDDDGLLDQDECPGGDNPDCPDSTGNGIDDFRDPNMFVNSDTDGDGVHNILDLDNDNDGLPDVLEFCGGNGLSCFPGGLHPDSDADNDQVPNFMDADDPAVNNPCADVNGDGICDRVSDIYDLDGDGIANHNDLDADNDGIPDMYEAGHTAPDADGNGMIDGGPAVFGQNGLYNPISSDPNSFLAVIIYVVRNSDGDHIFDFLDLDADNDGIHDVAEIGYQAWDSNDDGIIDNGFGLPDISWLGIPKVVSSVWTGQPIPKPRDKDLDAVPDYRDIDSDNDGIYDVAEQKVVDSDNDGEPGTGPIGPLQVDAAGRVITDALGQAFSSTTMLIDTDGDGTPDMIDVDSDGDNIPDVLEAQFEDNDQDGVPGYSPITTNSRGVILYDYFGTTYTPISDPRDLDADGMPDFQDIDRDGDGIRDGYECYSPYDCVDTDNDGMPDVDDLNSDGDCDTDEMECPGGDPCPDINANGVPDFRQFDCCPGFIPTLTDIEPAIIACSGKTVVLTTMNTTPFGSDLTYTWNGPGYTYTNTVSNQSPLTATILPAVTNAGTYTLSVTSGQGCQGNTLSVDLTVKPTPLQPVLQVDPTVICIGDEIYLSTQVYTGPGLGYTWQFTPVGGSMTDLTNTVEPLYIIPNAGVSNSGIYTVAVTIDGCTSDASGTVVVSVLPPADLQAAQDSFVLFIEDKIVESNVLTNDYFNTGSAFVAIVEPPNSGSVLLLANGDFKYTAEPGFSGRVEFKYELCGELCERDCDTAKVVIIISKDNVSDTCHVFNIISPNNDGVNDFLEIPCLEYFPDHDLQIFNRWGDLIYKTVDYKQDWNAQWKGHPLPPGTYFYLLQVFGDNAHELQGYITIIR